MAKTGDFPLPDGHYEPYTVITGDDHTGWIIIATALGLAMSLLSTTIRVALKSRVGQEFGLDDLLLAIATVSLIIRYNVAYHCTDHTQLLAIVQESIIFGAASNGLGKRARLIGPADMTSIQKVSRIRSIWKRHTLTR